MDINLIRTRGDFGEFCGVYCHRVLGLPSVNRNRFEADGRIVFEESNSQERA